jgi:hypothetical protein
MRELSNLKTFAREATASVAAPPFESLVDRVRTRRRRRAATALAGLALGAVVLAVATSLAGRTSGDRAPATDRVASDARAVAIVNHPQREVLSEARTRESNTTVMAVAAPLPDGARAQESYALLVHGDRGSRAEYLGGYPTVQHLDAGWFLVCTLTPQTTYEPALLVSATSTVPLRDEEPRRLVRGDLIGHCSRPLGTGVDVYAVSVERDSVRPLDGNPDPAALARDYPDLPLDEARESMVQDTIWVQDRAGLPWGLWNDGAVWVTDDGTWHLHRLTPRSLTDANLVPAIGPPGVMAFVQGVPLSPSVPMQARLLESRLQTSVDGGATWQIRLVPSSLTVADLLGEQLPITEGFTLPDGWEDWPRATE